jgi:prevent-host-death family protein
MTDVLPFSEVKAHPSELADRVEVQHERIMVTRNGRPSFVLMSPDDLESLEETLDIVRDDDLMKSLRKSRVEAASGKRLKLKDHPQETPVYEVEITPEGLRHLNKLSPKIQDAALASVFGQIAANRARLSKPLLGELVGLRSAKRGDYRIIYQIVEEEK